MNRFEKVFQQDSNIEKEAPKNSESLNHKAIEALPPAFQGNPEEYQDYLRDPRPDLTQDHELWVSLLLTARAMSQDIFMVFHALRCGGACLEKSQEFGLVIKPGEWNPQEYSAFRSKWLAPRKDEILKALKMAAAPKSLLQSSLRDFVSAKVRAIESKALALGWTHQDLWAEKEWTDPLDGRRRESLCKALFSASELWGDAQIGEITSEYAEILVPGPGLALKEPVKMRYFRVPPYLSQQPQLFATSKKEAV